MERLRVVFLATLIALAYPGVVQAATVSAPVVTEPPDSPESTVFYAAEPGEANDLTVTVSESPLVVTYEDAGAEITAGENCESVDEHTARCFGPITLLDTRLGDGDDTVHLTPDAQPTPLLALASGGSGDDHLFGGSGFELLDGDGGHDTIEGGGGNDRIGGGADDDELNGDDGSDELDGGTGDDVLDGGDGADRLRGDGENTLPAGADTIEGGAGEDVVTYYLRPEEIDVDLARGTADEGEGAGDTLSGIEDAQGARGGGRLAGDAGPNKLDAGYADAPVVLSGRGGNDTLHGGLEDDVLSGGEGNDVLTGSGGSDSFHAGAGADELQTLSIGGDDGDDHAISCGPDEDVVTTADLDDLIPRSCERVRFDRGFLLSPVLERVKGPAIVVDLERPRGSRACRAVVGLYGPSPAGATEEPRKIAFRNIEFRKGRLRAVIHPNAYGRRLLKAHRHLRIQVRTDTLLGCDDSQPPHPRPGFGFTTRL
jgi:Ca2+-binding RTX toxin-like protein